MHSMIITLGLTMVGGAALIAPVAENASNRAILYWLVLPALAFGTAAMFSHLAGR